MTFPNNIKLIDRYQRKFPILFAKYKEGAYQTGFFCGGSNINLKLVLYEYNVVIMSILQSYVLPW